MALSEEMEKVIEAALADGVITNKERTVLHNLAVQYGVDPDEVDVIVDGRLQQRKIELDMIRRKVFKCPSCGEIISGMTAVCPSCGQVLDTVSADNKALKAYMAELEKKLVQLKSCVTTGLYKRTHAEIEGLIRQGKALYDGNRKISDLIQEVETSMAEFDRQRKRKSMLKWGAIVAVVLAFFCYRGISSFIDSQSSKPYIPAVDKQYTELVAKIDALPYPDADNWEELIPKVEAIRWNDIDGAGDYNDKMKKKYLKRKRAYTEQLGTVCRSEGVSWRVPDWVIYSTEVNY